MDALDQALLIGVHGGDRLHEVLHARLLCLRVAEVDLEILLGQHHERRSGRAHLFADALEADLLQLLARDRLCARPNEAKLLHSACGLTGLSKRGPTRHEANLLAVAVGSKTVVLGAEPVEALRKVLHVAPALGPHVQCPVHAGQALIAFLDRLDDADSVAPDRADVSEYGVRRVLGLVVGDDRREGRLRKRCRDVGAAEARGIRAQRRRSLGEGLRRRRAPWQLRARRPDAARELGEHRR
mmetsp:Transcript_120421/g.351747  ORF Transcript_120421/g.351747 Transcript_120421/m.351747 type:complete len:241 (-) Transcript_120421:59-781(-)